MVIKRQVWFYLGLLALALSLTLAAPVPTAWAQEDGPTDDEVNAIAKDMYCPVCENIPLDVCGTQACVQWRSLIRERLEQGWTEQEIKDYFVAQYGDRVLATPPARGFNWLVYVLPPLAIAAGGLVLFSAVRNWRRTPSEEPSMDRLAELSDDPYVARLEQELAARQGSSPGANVAGATEEDHD